MTNEIIQHVPVHIVGSVPFNVSNLFNQIKDIRRLSKIIGETNKDSLFCYEIPSFVKTLEDKVAGFISRSEDEQDDQNI